jgi:hypothetical protein
LHGTHRILQQNRFEAGGQRVQGRRTHAVIRGQPADEQPLAVLPPQALGQPGVLERRVGLALAHRALVDDHRMPRQRQRRRQFGAVRSGHAMHRPRAALLAKGAMLRRMPVARGQHRQATVVELLAIAVQHRDDGIAAGHGQRPAGQKIVLHVDDEQHVPLAQLQRSGFHRLTLRWNSRSTCPS